jgi:Methylase involved in ubiquinone/menaquinone biosynthesis
MSLLERQKKLADRLGTDGSRTDIWSVLSAVLPVDTYLNLGYSRRGWPHVFGSPQRRLVDRVAEPILSTLRPGGGRHLLDLGAGRGGPAARLETAHRFDVTGIELLPSNTAAAAHSEMVTAAAQPDFVTADMTRLPVAAGRFGAATAIDSLVYVSDKSAALQEMKRVLKPDGVCVVTDLVRSSITGQPESVFTDFTEAWGMPALVTTDEYRTTIHDAGFQVVESTDIGPHSLDKLSKWARLYLSVVDRQIGRPLERGLERAGLDPAVITRQIRAAYRALPGLKHVLVRMRPTSSVG